MCTCKRIQTCKVFVVLEVQDFTLCPWRTFSHDSWQGMQQCTLIQGYIKTRIIGFGFVLCDEKMGFYKMKIVIDDKKSAPIELFVRPVSKVEYLPSCLLEKTNLPIYISHTGAHHLAMCQNFENFISIKVSLYYLDLWYWCRAAQAHILAHFFYTFAKKIQ